jgi:hypothetical protein
MKHLIAELSPQKPMFDPRLVYVSFVVKKVAMRQVFLLQLLRFLL